MNRTTKTIFCLMIICSALTGEFATLKEACPGTMGEQMKFLFDKNSDRYINFDFNEGLKTGEFLGKGSYGKVYKVYFPEAVEKYSAVKVISTQDVELLELSILNELGKKGYAPALYGCKYNSKSTYIATQLLYKDLDYAPVKTQIRGKKMSRKLEMYKDIFVGLKELWDLGYVHNDIKPMNMMTNKEVSKIYLIDFGLAQRKGEKRQSWMGTPMYRSPNFTMDPRGKLYQKDDMYSAALSIAEIESEAGYDAIWNIFTSFGRRPISAACYKTLLSKDCRKPLFDNSVKILASHQFGKYSSEPDKQTKETINLTTLVGNIILFKDFNFSYETVIEIFDRLIKEAKNKENPGVIDKVAEQDPVMKKIKLEGKDAREKNKMLSGFVMGDVVLNNNYSKKGKLYGQLHQYDNKKKNSEVYQENKELFKSGRKGQDVVHPKQFNGKDWDYEKMTEEEIKKLENLDQDQIKEIADMVEQVLIKNKQKKEGEDLLLAQQPKLNYKYQNNAQPLRNVDKNAQKNKPLNNLQPVIDNKIQKVDKNPLPKANKNEVNKQKADKPLYVQGNYNLGDGFKVQQKYLGPQQYLPIQNQVHVDRYDGEQYLKKQNDIVAKIMGNLERSDMLDKQMADAKLQNQQGLRFQNGLGGADLNEKYGGNRINRDADRIVEQVLADKQRNFEVDFKNPDNDRLYGNDAYANYLKKGMEVKELDLQDNNRFKNPYVGGLKRQQDYEVDFKNPYKDKEFENGAYAKYLANRNEIRVANLQGENLYRNEYLQPPQRRPFDFNEERYPKEEQQLVGLRQKNPGAQNYNIDYRRDMNQVDLPIGRKYLI